MTTEKSCGAVVFTRIRNKIFYVIIKHLNAHHGFPKGHMEPGENERATALREIYEETGLCVTLSEEFREEISYTLPGRTNTLKKAVYFLARFENQQINFDTNELESAELMTFDEAISVLEHNDLKHILQKAHALVS